MRLPKNLNLLYGLLYYMDFDYFKLLFGHKRFILKLIQITTIFVSNFGEISKKAQPGCV